MNENVGVICEDDCCYSIPNKENAVLMHGGCAQVKGQSHRYSTQLQ